LGRRGKLKIIHRQSRRAINSPPHKRRKCVALFSSPFYQSVQHSVASIIEWWRTGFTLRRLSLVLRMADEESPVKACYAFLPSFFVFAQVDETCCADCVSISSSAGRCSMGPSASHSLYSFFPFRLDRICSAGVTQMRSAWENEPDAPSDEISQHCPIWTLFRGRCAFTRLPPSWRCTPPQRKVADERSPIAGCYIWVMRAPISGTMRMAFRITALLICSE